MMIRIFALLCIAQSCLAVTVIINEKEVDCNGHCACCEGGEAECGYADGKTEYCLKGCVNTIYGSRCKNSCPLNCATCDQIVGRPCFTCKDSLYDINSACSMSCPLGCDGPCSDDGTCSACTPNFEGARCDACIPGKYGENCSMNCNYQNCRCTDLNGCDSCKTGFAGDFCMQCVTEYYGANCNISCPTGCKGGTCMRNGACIECNTGYYGEQCNDYCSKGCRDAVCHRNGTCACTDNFTGTKCIECVEDKYGDNCQHECSDGCSTLSCDKEDGSCVGGCKTGLYGMNCSQKCTDIENGCLKCSQLNGTCLVCKTGFYPSENGDCTTCNSNCNNGECNPETGKCINGCAVSFWGDMCDVNCSSKCGTCQQDSGICDVCTNLTLHGLYCNESCSSSCFESKCDLKTGHCSNGCSGDFFGHLCKTKCPQNCLRIGAESKCDARGHCYNGCINGFEEADCSERRTNTASSTIIALAILSGVLGILLICSVAGCYLWNRRMSKSIEQNSETHLNQRATERAYEQLQRPSNEPTNRSAEDNYTMLSM
ncbi:multiple epidermal growth factor-like domains protein 11 [Mya arenaria]|uniref:multiple epidermal growth factor-like domains protein 11 n=1 Tax=Mya arenaria TaxID=6604 RepID=UPI0022E41958|nr:multiple epidermal growth factor-like domains protein 11 [Mya arenaria]XP_052764711.1 multiple epidermal growth factor-like domains protein 11 [Mya arenaria]